MTNGPAWDGSPSRMATLAPGGRDAGASFHTRLSGRWIDGPFMSAWSLPRVAAAHAAVPATTAATAATRICFITVPRVCRWRPEWHGRGPDRRSNRGGVRGAPRGGGFERG